MWLYALPFPREEETLEFLEIAQVFNIGTDTTISLGQGQAVKHSLFLCPFGPRAASLNPRSE